MHGFWKFILLLRPHNAAAAVLSVEAGHALSSGRISPPWLLLASVAIATSAGNVINDLRDVDIDAINKPGRPLPSGAVSVRAAGVIYYSLLVILLILLLNLPPVQAAWIVLWVILLHVYSVRLKRLFLAGNLLVAAVSASGFLLGAYAGGDISTGFIPAGFTFPFVTGREIVKDCEDIEGDRRCGTRTMPVLLGIRVPLNAAAVIFLLLAVTFPLPYLAGIYGRAYGLIMAVSVTPVLLLSFILSVRKRRPGLVSILLKVGMFFGILAFFFSGKG